MKEAESAKKAGLREMIAEDKERMLPLNFAYAYILKPAYVVLAFGSFLLFSGLLNAGNVPLGLVCLGLMGLLICLLLAAGPYVRKKAIQSELKRYQLDRSDISSQDEWEFSENELSVRFNRYGMKLNGVLFYYNHMTKLVMTSNDHQRVVIFLYFAYTDDEGIALPLTPEALKMLSDFEVRLDNQPTLDQILEDPEGAFVKIYRHGKL